MFRRIIISIIFSLLLARPAYAEVKIKDIFPPANNFSDIGQLISIILPNVFVLAGVLLFILLIFGGFSFIMSAGQGDGEGAGKGKQMITWAIVGFILIFASIWIMQLIGFLTGVDIFKLPTNL